MESVLSSHPRIHCYDEILRGYERESKLDHFYRYWLERVRADGAQITCLGMVRSFDSYLAKIFSLPDMDAVGVDIKYNQFVHLPDIDFFLRKHGVKFIHLIRRNILKALTSKKLNGWEKQLGRRAHVAPNDCRRSPSI